MTTKDQLTQMLTDCGMFPNQADEVMSRAMPTIEKLVPDYRVTWDRPATEYPAAVYAVMWSITKPIALAWIEENCPKAWFKPMFMEEQAV